MALVKTEGVILQSRPFSESSKILAVFTRDAGRVSVLVKGGRKGAKKFPGGLETLNRVELQYYHRDGRDLQNFKSFDLIESYQNVRGDLRRTYTALSIAETVLRTTASEDSDPDLYWSLIAVLATLDNQEQRPWAVRWKGLLDICRSLGFGLALDGCSQCGDRGSVVGFDLAAGGFVGEVHQTEQMSIIPSSGEIWGILRFLNQCPHEVTTRVAVSSVTGRQIEALFLQYFKYHIPALKKFESWQKLMDIYWGEGES